MLYFAVAQLPLSHERLRYQNIFKTPEEVIEYYCARDASGFVWSGLLEVERKAFTLWDQVPSLDSFFVASKYDVGKSRFLNNEKTEAAVDVSYDLIAISDGNGSRFPVTASKRQVTFTLKKLKGQWKILRPAPAEIASVVLESKFPFPR